MLVKLMYNVLDVSVVDASPLKMFFKVLFLHCCDSFLKVL